MRVSSLFSLEKYNKEKEDTLQYRAMVGQDNTIVVLENDMGKPGELFDGAALDLSTDFIRLQESKDVEVRYIPTNTIISIDSNYDIHIKTCYMQPRSSDDGMTRMYNIGNVDRMHIESDLYVANYIGYDTSIKELFVEEDDSGFISMLSLSGFIQAMIKCNIIEFGYGCRFIEDELFITDENKIIWEFLEKRLNRKLPNRSVKVDLCSDKSFSVGVRGSLTIENIPEEIMEEATKLIINQMMLHDYGVKIRFRRYGLEYTNGAIQRMQE